ncbi:hypothetical protein D9C73_012343 [Collichthys lucidus]|uniref:Uncharacterized protein n=1 Tax=Collichthys lucidus TaxID=240159 RepID=A0A4U5UVX6_COLLU|nr:hypothetical protein D9C73_012343 [Collichthys lucidus]
MNAPQGVIQCVCGQFKVTTSYVPLLYGTAVLQQHLTTKTDCDHAKAIFLQLSFNPGLLALPRLPPTVTELWEQWSRQFCLALLALSALTAASDSPDCAELLKPLEDRSKVAGKWIFYVGTSDNKEALKELKTINSSWIELSPIPDSDDMTLRWRDKMMDGKCHYGGVNSTFSENSTRVTFHFNSSKHEHVGKHLVTCPDCILWTDLQTSVCDGKEEEARKSRNLYLFTKSGTLDDSHLEDFKKQAACLNFPPDFFFPQTTDLCPDDTDENEEEQ